jgi:hypothetical protein
VLKDQFQSQGMKVSLAFSLEHIVSWMRMMSGLRLWIILLRASFFGAPPTPCTLKERNIIYPLSMGLSFSKGPCDGK